MSIRQVGLSRELLVEAALGRGEGVLSARGVLTVQTGKRTGRSPKDRFIVKNALTESSVAWGDVNQPMTPEAFQKLWDKAVTYLEDKESFEQHLQVGQDKAYALPVKVITQWAWHSLFCLNMFIEPTEYWGTEQTEWTLLSVPELTTCPTEDGTTSDGCVVIDLQARRVLLCGMRYAGEMKKAMFSALNFIVPMEGVLPMHCAANMSERGDVALFFGLSGTGKTTLSSDPSRFLIGDDEHGWSEQGVFNFEGGCYAKCIHLSHEAEPVIYEAIKPGAVMENVVLDAQGHPDFDDTRYTQNTRVAYPRTHVPLRVEENQGGQPSAVIFLACDLFGVLPAVSVLDAQQAAYYFLSGYTALVGSTEVGAKPGINPTFSSCFGAPFFPREPQVYAQLLQQHLARTGAGVYLVNTGWYGGRYGHGGQRYPIQTTRQIITAITSGEIESTQGTRLPEFNLLIPNKVGQLDADVLNPQHSWSDLTAYQAASAELIRLFAQNAEKTMQTVAEEVRMAGPQSHEFSDG